MLSQDWRVGVHGPRADVPRLLQSGRRREEVCGARVGRAEAVPHLVAVQSPGGLYRRAALSITAQGALVLLILLILLFLLTLCSSLLFFKVGPANVGEFYWANDLRLTKASGASVRSKAERWHVGQVGQVERIF